MSGSESWLSRNPWLSNVSTFLSKLAYFNVSIRKMYRNNMYKHPVTVNESMVISKPYWCNESKQMSWITDHVCQTYQWF